MLAVEAPLVVLPFDVRATDGDSDASWKGVMIEEAVSAHFEAAGLNVIGPFEKNRLLEDIGVVPGEPVSPATALLIARELRARRLVFGTLTLPPDAGEVEVQASLVDVDSGATLGVVDDYGPANELPGLASLLAKNLIRVGRDGVPPGFEACAARRARIPLEALEAGARARITTDASEQRAHLERAVAASEDYLEAHVLLGSLLLREGHPREAIDVLVKARGDDRIYRNAYFDLGVAYLREDMAQAAVQVFKALTDSENGAAALNNLGVSLMRLSRFDEATKAFEESCGRGLDEATCQFNLGWAYWRQGKGAKALEQFTPLVASRPLDAEARFLHSAAAMSQAMADDAERSRDVALLLAPELADVEPGTVSGWARSIERSSLSSTDAYGDVSVLDEDLEATADLLDARFLCERGRTQEAIQLLQRTLYREPDASFVRHELASLHAETGALESAVSELSILLWTEPSADMHVELARLYLQMEEPSRALEEVDRALDLDPEHGDALRLKTVIGSDP